MKRIILLITFVFPLYLLGQQTIIIDHTSVDLWDDIPQAYLDTIKKRWLSIPGESHSRAFRVGLQMVEDLDADYAVSIKESGDPEPYTEINLRASHALWGDYASSSGWRYHHGEEDWWTNSTAIERIKASITYCNSINITVGYMGFAWCWDAVALSGPPSPVTDPVYGCRWFGQSIQGPLGSLAWGIDDEDNSITGNSVNMDTYISVTQEYVDYCSDNSINTVVFFTTGTVDGSWGSEAHYQAHLKYEHLRSHVIANGGVLFDYADILCYDDGASSPNTMTWNGNTFPTITITNLGDGTIGHIGSAGALRLGKALWVMMAMIEGWEDPATIIEKKNPAVNNNTIKIYPNPAGQDLNLVLPETAFCNTVEILDLSGRKLYSEPINESKKELHITNIDLPAGTYVVRIISNNIVYKGRISFY